MLQKLALIPRGKTDEINLQIGEVVLVDGKNYIKFQNMGSTTIEYLRQFTNGGVPIVKSVISGRDAKYDSERGVVSNHMRMILPTDKSYKSRIEFLEQRGGST